ncbi:hypothetical protein [Streptomyces chryseus]|uniref:hypothetical protein n=1 Tax=Streptomyces chryseus TaxID=68186 RepID=UPI00110FDD7C|nr:hypothetical protein [Streptomyces chryseus]GGX27091.1 hypothetical protein GCM10010353_47960 [Streptomyces chryseus]
MAPRFEAFWHAPTARLQAWRTGWKQAPTTTIGFRTPVRLGHGERGVVTVALLACPDAVAFLPDGRDRRLPLVLSDEPATAQWTCHAYVRIGLNGSEVTEIRLDTERG